MAAHGLPPAQCRPERPERPQEPGDGVCVRARPSSEEPAPGHRGVAGASVRRRWGQGSGPLPSLDAGGVSSPVERHEAPEIPRC